MSASETTLADADAPDLEALDATVREALERADEGGVRVLGYGEIAAVVGWPREQPAWACKRLPPFRDEAQLARYRSCLHDYLAALRDAGITTLPTALESLETPHGLIAYLVQPVVDGERLGPRYLASRGPEAAVELVERVTDLVLAGVTPRLGLDAQLSNWFVTDAGELRYLDLTTPLLRDEAGADRLDADLFLASLPWAMRGFVYRFVLRDVLDKYFDPRGIVVDLLANLYKEGLADRLEVLLPAIDAKLSEPVTQRELGRYYRSDARMWAALQRLRRADRWWQRKVRRRVYPFLLPGRITR
jgi:hypothetical protein